MINRPAFYAAFGRRVRDARDGALLTQADLARRVGISRASIANIETGRQRLALHVFVEICTVLGMDPAAALAITRPPPKVDTATPSIRAHAAAMSAALQGHQSREIERLKL